MPARGKNIINFQKIKIMAKKGNLLEGYKNWLIDRGYTKGTADSYISEVKAIQANICSYIRDYPWKKQKEDNYEYRVSQFAKKDLCCPTYDFIEAIAVLLQEGDRSYSMAIVNAMCYMAKLCKDTLHKIDRTFSNRCSHFNSFRLYISSMQFTEGHHGKHEVLSDKYRKNIGQEMLPKIDGFKGLIDEFEREKKSGEARFIRYAIEQSYFFHPEIVKDRMNKIRDSFVSGKALPARRKGRKQVDTGIRIDEETGVEMLVDVDPDGNKNVREIISDYTGYTIGSKKIIRNYIISHLWGQAFDPRYFTNLWNIAIVPAWANSLLDKNDDSSPLAAEFKATIMKVAKELYHLADKKSYWDDLKMSEPSVGSNAKAATYEVKLLCRKEDGRELGAIVVQTVKIKK